MFHLKQQKGICIIEILLAILMLGSGTLAMSHLYLNMMRHTGDEVAYLEAIDLATKGMEAVHGSPEQLDKLEGWNETDLQGATAIFTRDTQISGIYTLNNVDYKMILVTVSWQDKQNAQQQVQLSSLSVGIHMVANNT